MLGKTAEREDRYPSRFIELNPDSSIVEVIEFDSVNPDFAGEMVMEVILEGFGKLTKVTILFTNIPPGIKQENNEAGTTSALEKLAKYLEPNN
jgi:hypothetical protein